MINKITIKNNIRIIDNKYVKKRKTNSLNNTFNYLLSRSFNYFPEIVKEDDKYTYYKYINDIKEPKEQKIIDLIILLSILHSKTTIYKEIDLNYYKDIYENINNQIDDTYNYYNQLMDNIDLEIYMSPSNYLIARNISLIYKSLNYAKKNIDEWYKMVQDKKTSRVALIHNNISLDHYIKEDKSYLISWDKSKIDIPIYDLVKLYKTHYLEFNFKDILKIYLNKYSLTKEEMLLFLIIISIPNKILLKDSEYKTTLEVRRIIDYTYKTEEILKEYSIKKQSQET